MRRIVAVQGVTKVATSTDANWRERPDQFGRKGIVPRCPLSEKLGFINPLLARFGLRLAICGCYSVDGTHVRSRPFRITHGLMALRKSHLVFERASALGNSSACCS